MDSNSIDDENWEIVNSEPPSSSSADGKSEVLSHSSDDSTLPPIFFPPFDPNHPQLEAEEKMFLTNSIKSKFSSHGLEASGAARVLREFVEAASASKTTASEKFKSVKSIVKQQCQGQHCWICLSSNDVVVNGSNSSRSIFFDTSHLLPFIHPQKANGLEVVVLWLCITLGQ